jgi:septation ring formation regulator EzrA
MTFEEKKSTIQTGAESRPQYLPPQHQAELGSTANEISQLFQQIIKDLGPHQANLEKSFRMFIEILRVQKERMDRNDDAHREIDTRLKFLISSQTLFGEKVDKLTSDIAEISVRFDQLAVQVDQVNTRFDWIADRLDRIDEYLKLYCQPHVQTDERLDRMSECAEAHHQHLTRIDERLDRIGIYVQAHTQYITQIDKQLDRMSKHIEVHSRHLSKIDERFILTADMQFENAEDMK